jgi:putative membrane protein
MVGDERADRMEPNQSYGAKMNALIASEPVTDLRVYLAQERTFLAWIRTGIALMGFGLVVAHFQLLADQPHIVQHTSGVDPQAPSLWFGTALVATGAAVNLISAWRYFRLVGEMSRGQFANRSLSRQGVIVALFLALLGIAMTIYLTLAPGPLPPQALQA